jgi:hypothetical protein
MEAARQRNGYFPQRSGDVLKFPFERGFYTALFDPMRR